MITMKWVRNQYRYSKKNGSIHVSLKQWVRRSILFKGDVYVSPKINKILSANWSNPCATE
jgi:hypothetical protein